MAIINRIRRLYKNEEAKTLISNFVSLSALQGINLVLPLLLLPYLVRVLGMELYGLIAFSTAVVYYFQVITDYGFNLTATREISVHRNDSLKISEIYNSVMIIKLILLVFSLFILTVVVFIFSELSANYEIYFLSFGVVIGYTILPTWLFQGMEKMKFLTLSNLITKLFFTILIFVFVKSKDDYLLVPIFTSAGYILSGIISLFIVRRTFKIPFASQKYATLKIHFTDGWYVFLSQLKITLFSNSNILILGIFAGNVQVGYFSSAEKIIRTLASLQTPIVNTMFPYISKNIKTAPLKIIGQIYKVAKIGSWCYLSIILGVFVFSEAIVKTMFGELLTDVVIALRIILIVPLFVFLNNLFGTQILLNTGKDKVFFLVLLFTAILNLILIFPLTYLYGYIGTSISVVFAEAFLFIGMFYYAKRQIKVLKSEESK